MRIRVGGSGGGVMWIIRVRCFFFLLAHLPAASVCHFCLLIFWDGNGTMGDIV